MYYNIRHLSCTPPPPKTNSKARKLPNCSPWGYGTLQCDEAVANVFVQYTGAENFMPKLWEVIRVTKTKFYCQGTECRRCVLAALRPVKVGLTKFGNQAKPPSILKKNHTSLEQMFQPTATDLDTQPTTTQQRLTCALKNARLLSQQYGQ